MKYNIKRKDKEFNLKLELPIEVYKKIMAYAEIASGEIQGWADLEYNPDRRCFVAGEVYLIEQEGGAGHVIIDEEVQSRFNLELAKKGKKQMPRLWWHSHVEMQTFFSGTDEDTLSEYKNDTFFVGLVVNKFREMACKAYVYTEETTTMLDAVTKEEDWLKIEDLEVKIAMEYDEIPADLIKEVETKVKKPVPHKLVPWNNPFKMNKLIKPGDKEYTSDYESLAKRVRDRVAQPNRLPKAPSEALAKVEHLRLERIWNVNLQEYVYIDPVTDKIWIDFWEALDDADFELPLESFD